MTRVRKSLVQSSLAYFGQLAISLALVVIVSRILPPDQVGSYLMAYAVVLLLLPLRDFQLQNYVIQRDEISPALLKPVMFVSAGSSVAGWLVCLIGSVIFFASYPTPEIAHCLLIMSLTFVIRPFSMVPMAVLAREMRHGEIAAIRLSGAAAKLAVTLGLLAMGWGPEALAWGVVAESAVELVSIAFVGRGLRMVSASPGGSTEVVKYCLPYSGAHLAITLSVSLTSLMVGAYQGLALAAFYNRGRMVTQLFRSGIEGAIHPIVLSQFASARSDRQLLKRNYLHATGLLTAISWPALVWLIAVAEPLTVTLFGMEWLPTALLLQILSAGALIYAASALSQQLHASIAQTREILIREVWLQAPYLAILLVVAQISTAAVAWASVLSALIGFVVHQRLLHRAIGLQVTELATANWRSGLAAGAVGIVTLVTLALLRGVLHDGPLLLLLGLVAAIVWLATLAASQHPILPEARKFLSDASAVR